MDEEWPGLSKARCMRYLELNLELVNMNLLPRILEAQSDGLEDLHLFRQWATDGLEGADVARAKVMDEAINILNATCCYPVSSLFVNFDNSLVAL